MTARVTASTLALALLLTMASAHATDQRAAGAVVCAEHEVLLQTLIEAHGQAPDAASAIVAEASIAITQARAACADGRIGYALALYDRLIAELAGVVSYRGE